MRLKKRFGFGRKGANSLAHGFGKRRWDEPSRGANEDRVVVDFTDLTEEPAHGRRSHPHPFGGSADAPLHEQGVERQEETEPSEFQERFFGCRGHNCSVFKSHSKNAGQSYADLARQSGYSPFRQIFQAAQNNFR